MSSDQSYIYGQSSGGSESGEGAAGLLRGDSPRVAVDYSFLAHALLVIEQDWRAGRNQVDAIRPLDLAA